MHRKYIKKIAFYTWFLTQEKRYLNDIRNQKRLIILNLHKISPVRNDYYPSLVPELFEALLKYITEHFKIITFNEIKKEQKSTKPLMILSFDDGYYDFLEYAMPLLKKYNVKANLNIVPECVESGLPMWNIRLYDFLNSASIDVINEMKLTGFDHRLMKNDQNGKLAFGLALSRFLKNRPKVERDELLQKIFEKIDNDESIEYTRMLNKEEIIKIAKIHEIGVHSYSHESMGFESKEYFEQDFQRCKNYFENELKLPLTIYAFPNGSYKNYQIDFLINQGIEHVLLVENRYADCQSHSKTRFTFFADSISEVKMRALGFYR